MRIIILGLTNKSGLAVARNLSKFGCTIDAIYIKDVAARHSKYISKSFYLGDPEHNVSAYIDQLLQHLSVHKYDGLIPIHDGALEICRYRYIEISSFVKIVGINKDEIYKYSIDKHEMLKIGAANGLLIPKGYFVDSLESYQSISLLDDEFPVVAKPVSSAKIINNKLNSYSVKVCKNKEELTDFIRENIRSVNILIQEFVQGYGIGYDFISKDGNIQNEYIHRRINENGGVSTLRESLTTDCYGIKERVIQTVQAMQWSGVGMLEFMIKPDGTPILMEFNGRFFGSTEVSVKSGINLPVLFLKQFVLEETIPVNIPLKNVSVRFFHDELVFYTSLITQKKFKMFFQWLMDLVKSVFSPNHYFETSIFTDYKFSLAFYLYEFRRWKLKFDNKKQIKNIEIYPLNKEDLNGVKRITFFCLGNICRSPFAQYFAEKTTQKYEFNSLGVISKEQRLSPMNGVLAAKDFGIDLNAHSSKCISDADVHRTDLFVVMDKANYHALVIRGISKNCIRFLASEEIKDPYGKSLNEFKATYKQIEQEIKKIFTI